MNQATKKAQILKIARKRWVTPLSILYDVGCLSLSQRMGELKREGHKVVSKIVPGEKYHQYRVIG